MKPFYLRQPLPTDKVKLGQIKGVAYTGAPIAEHGMWENLIVDVATLSIAKQITPMFRDHSPALVAGQGEVTIEGSTVKIDGMISSKTAVGKEILDLAEDGFPWEMSLGVFNYELEEVTNEEVNGQMIEHGFVLRNGLLREVSIVALGADMATNAEFFSQKKGDSTMLTKEQYIKLACACGGHKDTTPDELEAKVKETKLMTEEQEQKIDELTSEIEAMKKQIADKQAEIDAMKEEDEEEERTEQVQSALDAKGIEFSADEIKSAVKSKDKTEMLLSLIEKMPSTSKKKVDPALLGKTNVGNKGDSSKKDEKAIRLEAQQLIKDGKAKDLMEAINMVEA